VLLRPLPVRAEAELVVGWRGLPDADARRWPFSAEDLALVRATSRLLAGVAGVAALVAMELFATGADTSASVAFGFPFR